MKRYDSYKDSGIEWIGEIPSDWKVKRIKHTTYVKGRIGWQGLRSDEFLEAGASYVVTGTDFENGKINWHTCYQITQERYDEDPYIQLREGDLLITKDGTIGKIALVKNIPTIATLNSGIFVTRPKTEDYITLFMYWILNSDVFDSFFNNNKSGSTIVHLYQNVFNEFKFICPPINEQTQIARYLDHKTGQIDKLIADKQKLIELLNEERTAMINQAVTKGLNPDAPMKDSGIEWLGEIPAHWEVKKLKYVVSKIGSGVTPKGGAEVYEESGIPFIRSQNIYFDGFRIDEIAFISKEVHHSMSNSKVCSGDVLLNITGGSIGRCFYVTNEFSEANVNQHVCIIRPNEKIETPYLFNLVSSLVIQQQIENCQIGGNRESVNFEQLKNFIFPLPDEEERLKIVEYIKDASERISQLLNNTKSEIDLLKEYKTALISEVVTGKVDVRDEMTADL